jgi:hypothetical protein
MARQTWSASEEARGRSAGMLLGEVGVEDAETGRGRCDKAAAEEALPLMSSSVVEKELGAWDEVVAVEASMRLLTARGRTRGRGACC